MIYVFFVVFVVVNFSYVVLRDKYDMYKYPFLIFFYVTYSKGREEKIFFC